MMSLNKDAERYEGKMSSSFETVIECIAHGFLKTNVTPKLNEHSNVHCKVAISAQEEPKRQFIKVDLGEPSIQRISGPHINLLEVHQIKIILPYCLLNKKEIVEKLPTYIEEQIKSNLFPLLLESQLLEVQFPNGIQIVIGDKEDLQALDLAARLGEQQAIKGLAKICLCCGPDFVQEDRTWIDKKLFNQLCTSCDLRWYADYCWNGEKHHGKFFLDSRFFERCERCNWVKCSCRACKKGGCSKDETPPPRESKISFASNFDEEFFRPRGGSCINGCGGKGLSIYGGMCSNCFSF